MELKEYIQQHFNEDTIHFCQNALDFANTSDLEFMDIEHESNCGQLIFTLCQWAWRGEQMIDSSLHDDLWQLVQTASEIIYFG